MDYESEGRTFESFRARHFPKLSRKWSYLAAPSNGQVAFCARTAAGLRSKRPSHQVDPAFRRSRGGSPNEGRQKKRMSPRVRRCYRRAARRAGAGALVRLAVTRQAARERGMRNRFSQGLGR